MRSRWSLPLPAALLFMTLFLLVALAVVSSRPGQASRGVVSYLPVSAMQPTPTPDITPTPPIPGGRVVPNDSLFAGSQWPLGQIRAADGWSISTGSPVVVAVIDTGVDYTHPDLSSKLVDPALWYDFADNDTDPFDPFGHGSHVSGITAAATNNVIGMAGTSWGARIMPLKVFSTATGGGYTLDVVAAIRYAADNGARVINLSLGSESNSNALQSAINYARARNVVVIAASGNCHQGGQGCSYADVPSYPAANAGVIAVAATNINDGHASYSTAGTYVDLAAPGGQGANSVTSTVPGGYGGFNGTSMAAPHVAGLAALILGMRPELTPDQVESILKSTTVDRGAAGWDSSFGEGRIDLRAALEATYTWPAGGAPLVESPVDGPLYATDCSLPHAQDRIILLPDVPDDGNAGPATADEMTTFRVSVVPEGTACTRMKALNQAAGRVVAELDPLLSLPVEADLLTVGR